MRLHVARALVVSAVAVLVVAASAACPSPALPDPPRACDPQNGRGCLSDEQCVDGACVPIGRCESDADCKSRAYRCVQPAAFCELRAGFGEECSSTVPCDAGEFCSLGRCRPVEGARPCGSRLDCAPGFGCDKLTFFCVEEAPCTFVDDYPEVACDAAETCNADLGVCVASCAGQCSVATEAEDCGAGRRCNGACRCVQCLSSADCGAGLVCNSRSGQCQSEDLCFSDDDCDAPLVCDPRTALCQVAPPPCFDDFDCTVAERCNVATGRCELPGGACIDDRFEDADTPATAEDVSLALDELKVLDGLKLCPDDDDVYVFALAAGDTLTVQARGTQPEARATLWLLDESAETSIDFAETPPRGSGTVTTTAQRDGVVYLRVNALLASTPYDLDVRRAAGAVCAPDFFETASGADDNDEPLTATPAAFVPTGVRMAAEICAGDVDHYAVDLLPGEGVRATASFDATSADLDIALLDADGDVVAEAAGTAEPEVVERRFVGGGRVYVRVRGFANSRGPYALVVDTIPPLACADAFEPDDAAPRAVIVANVTATGDADVVEERALCGPGPLADADRWSVDVEDFERLVVAASPEDPGLRVLLTIEDAAGQVFSRSPLGTGASSVSYDATTTGPLFVRAVGAFGQQGRYTLRLARENQGSCAPDAREPNDTPAQASALPGANDVVTICESDEDYFVLDGAAGKRAVVDLSFLHGDGDLDLQLLGLDGRQILATSDGQTDGEHVEAVLPVDGAYTIRVFSLTSGARSRYTLSTTLTSP